MAGRLRMQLAETLQLIHRQVETGQVQQRVLQHRAVAVGKHETIAVEPFRVDRIELQEVVRSEEHTSELQSLMRISYAVFCLKKNKHIKSKHKIVTKLQN